MGYLLLSILLACFIVHFLIQQRDLKRRIATQKNVRREELVPQHYKEFTEVEAKLWETAKHWATVREQEETFERVRFTAHDREFQVIRKYIRGIQDDFKRAHNIWSQIIIHSPEGKILIQLEWERIKTECAYYSWWLLSGLHLRTVGISVGELRQLTDIVASAAYRVRHMLGVLVAQGHEEFVDAILRQS